MSEPIVFISNRWLRITAMAPLPVAIISSVGFGLDGLMRGSGRVWAIVGLVSQVYPSSRSLS